MNQPNDSHITNKELDQIADEVLDATVKITPEHLAVLAANAVQIELPKPVRD